VVRFFSQFGVWEIAEDEHVGCWARWPNHPLVVAGALPLIQGCKEEIAMTAGRRSGSCRCGRTEPDVTTIGEGRRCQDWRGIS
jgi:hypothetical protein